jgi:hypothetical protein
MRRIRVPFRKADWAKETQKTKKANMLKWRGRAVPAFYDMPQGTQKARWGGWLVFEAAARRAHRDCQRPTDGLTLTIDGAGGNKSGGK